MHVPEDIAKGARARVEGAHEEQQRVLQATREGRPLDGEPHLQRRINRLRAVTGLSIEAAKRLEANTDPRELGLTGDALLGAERIQGRTTDFVGVAFLDLARAAAATVGRVVRSDLSPWGSGVLTSDRLFLTNHHVIDHEAAARSLFVEFNYERDVYDRPRTVSRFRLDPEDFFITSGVDELDFTVVAVGERVSGADDLTQLGFCPLSDADDKHALSEFVNVIQHPEGEYKQVVLRENQLVSRTPTALHYLADTMPGSSGSPVFNDDWEIIALHHWGGPYLGRVDDSGAPVPKDVNEGIRVSAIVRALKDHASAGAFEREASLSPDGLSVAYWSDATGEYQLYVRNLAGSAAAEPLTRFAGGFRYRPVWSPDSRRIAYADQRGEIAIFDVADRRTTRADLEPWADPTELAWSADSKWLAYTRTGSNRMTAIWGYDLASGRQQQLSAETFNASTPVFDPNGERLFFISYRNFNNANVDWIQQRITHRATTVVMAVPLRGTAFDAASFERRAVRFGAAPGSITALGATHDGNAIYGLTDLGGKPSVRLYDMRRQEEVVVPDAAGVTISPDGRHFLVDREGKSIVREVGGSAESTVHTTGMTVRIDLREEWRQIFQDAWRCYRDFFYAPKVGLGDWNLVRTRYAAMLERCLTRDEVNLVLGEMIGESSVGHAYLSQAGDVGGPPPPGTVGMLGADFALDNGAFRITRIHEGAPWDERSRSPLRDAAVGEYLLAVNGKPIDTRSDPRAAFVGMAGKAVQVTVGARPARNAGAREITITPLSNERDLRRRAWIEANRKHVADMSGGRIGYIHIPDFTSTGFNDVAQQFSGQIGRDALIIDARWSMGGWTSGIIAELLDRYCLTYAAIRESDRVWPGLRWGAHFGPKALLVNHVTVSAGEGFALFFRKRRLGPLIGSRTWGGSTGLNPVPALLDGGYVNVPNAPFFDENGWVWEGHGLEPDLPVVADPAKMVSEGDPQIDAAVKAVLEALASKPYRPPPEPN